MEDRKLAVKEYKLLQEKHGLPKLSELEQEFEFELDEKTGIIKILNQQIWDRISIIKSYIEGILHPQRYCCMTETGFLNKKEKERIYEFYKKIMIEYWKTVKSTFLGEEKRAKQLKNNYEFYQKVKKFSTIYSDKMIKGWSQEQEEEKNEGYIN